MNSLDRVRTALAGGIPDRVPVCLHNFMMATREADACAWKTTASIRKPLPAPTSQAVEKYGHDCIVVDTDTTMLAEAMGSAIGLCSE